MIIVPFYHSFICKFDVPVCCFPARQKTVKYLAVKQCVWGVIARVHPMLLFILAAFIFSVFISNANFAKFKGSLNIRVLQYLNHFILNCKITLKTAIWLLLVVRHEKVAINSSKCIDHVTLIFFCAFLLLVLLSGLCSLWIIGQTETEAGGIKPREMSYVWTCLPRRPIVHNTTVYTT